MSEKIKTIDVNGTILYYELDYHEGAYGDTFPYTKFYLELKTKMVKKYWLWGPLVERPDNETIFTIDFDITKPVKTKSELRDILEYKLEMYYRQNEIDNGELI